MHLSQTRQLDSPSGVLVHAMHWILRCLQIFFLHSLISQTVWANAVWAEENMPAMSLAPYLSTMLDPSGAVTIDQVVAGEAPEFSKNTQKTTAFGFTTDAVWLKFKIHNPTDRDLHISAILNSARLDHFTWHVVSDSEVVDSISGGAADGLRLQFARFPKIEVEIPAGSTKTIYTRSQSRTSQWLDLQIGCREAVNHNVLLSAMSDMALIGFCLAVFISSVLLGYIQRQRFYLYLGGFACSFLLYYLIFYGYLRLLWPDIPLWVEREAFGIICGISVLVFVKFNAAILGLHESTLRVRICHYMAIGFALLSLLAFVLLEFILAVQCFALMQALAYLCGSVALLWHLRPIQSSRIPHMATWFTWGLFIILLNLQFSNIIPIYISFGVLQQFFVPIILGGFIFSVAQHQQTLDSLKLDLEKSQRAETSARLSALRYQINPHFLFNTLTSIDALSTSAPERIHELIGKLSTFLRLRLIDSNNGLTKLRNELESLRAYIFIEKMRFGTSLSADFKIAPESEDFLLPEMILQPLVENAIKYGFDEDRDVDLLIKSTVTGGRLRITVSNPGTLGGGDSDERGLRIGLDNIRSRLRLYYFGDASFTISQLQSRVLATLEIPQLQSQWKN